MFISKHVTAVLSEVSHLVEVRLNSHLRVLPRAPHLQSEHKVLKHLTLHVCSTCLRLANQFNFIAGKNAKWTCRPGTSTKW